MNYVRTYKVLILGNKGVGTKSLRGRIKLNIPIDYFALMILEFDNHFQRITSDYGSFQILFQDTHDMRRLTPNPLERIKQLDSILLVYDITDRKSFQDIFQWFSNVKNMIKEKAILILIGNKADLEFERQVKFEEGQSLADSLGIQFYETSVIDGRNVASMYNYIIDQIKLRQKYNSY